MRQRLTIILLLSALALLATLALGWAQSVRLMRAAARVNDDARQLAERAQQQQPLTLTDARTLRLDLEALERALRPFRWLAVAGAPLSGRPTTLRQARQALAAADDLVAAAWWAALSIESDLEARPAAQAPAAELLPTALRALAANRARLVRARETLERVRSILPSDDALARSNVSTVVQAVPAALDALIIVSGALAQPGEQRWIVLIQNNDELRPTGGFISSVVELTLRDGRLDAMRYMNSYEIEAYRGLHPAPPGPLRQHMGAGVLLFRDANWSPDFPASAEALAALYQLDMGVPVAGVIAADTALAGLLLEALGPLDVPDHGVTVTADNVMETAIGFWDNPLAGGSVVDRQAHWQEWLDHRKDFGGALASAGLARARDLTPGDALHLAEALRRGAADKHLMAWAVGDARLQADLRRAGLDGGVRSPEGDYLMVVDSNVGWNKADRHIARAVDYRVAFGPDGPAARLTLAYRHRAGARLDECLHRAAYADSYDALTEQCYWDYVRVLAPRGSRLLAAYGSDGEVAVDRTAECGKASFGALLVVPPGEERTLTLEYALPVGALTEGGYRLFVQSQPGASPRDLVVTVERPAGLRAAAPWQPDGPARALWRGSPEGDWQGEVKW